MSGLFGTLNIGTRGMAASQTALQTTSHNLANMNTDGYTRQRVNFEAENPYHLGGVGQIGTGVKLSGVVRVIDDYVTKQIQQESGSYNRYAQKSEILSKLEMIFNEPSETGLSNGLSKFYSAWNYLGSNPELPTAKTMVSQEAQSLSDTLAHMSNQIEGVQADTVYAIQKDVMDFNNKIEQLNTLNQQIFNVTVKGDTPNDLLDQRDRLTTELASMSNVEFSYDNYQRVEVKLDGDNLLKGNAVKKLAIVSAHDGQGNMIITDGSKDSATQAGTLLPVGQVVIASEDGTYKEVLVTNGSIKGSQEALELVNNKQEELNRLVYSFATAVNTIHSNNYDVKGIPFFSETNSAKTLKVNEVILGDSSNVNAGQSIGEPSDELPAGDGSRATAISALATAKINYFGTPFDAKYDETTMSFEPQANGSTTSGAYNNMVTSMGIMKEQADNMAASQSEVLTFLENRRGAISGVSMNEEVVDMMKFSSAFQANARIISVVDEMLDTLINRTGV
ncbi:flagellar hook-associated protein FlgK [Jeotgalibaca arthritidis]|uniref:Flagellar hook-associated protein 1 n=1 Tax=Jeotgalibaca arthritidis TaxID=1868794 RepID=A0A6G7K9N7_9LACT|nr:flagellar hook-associated protein FlgK [Jeotgalibaca arthritidis]QII81957.1 flagellar hook-associated protein FlgK [Jeotgalibaca arthritidis]